MSHLILATNDLAAGTLRHSGVANVALGFCLRFVGKLPSEEQLAMGRSPARQNMLKTAITGSTPFNETG